MRTVAHARFRRWMAGQKQTEIAKILGCAQSHLSFVCADPPKARLGELHREAAEILSGIPQDDWLTPKERRTRSSAIARAKQFVAQAEAAPPALPAAAE